jgi:hypothetical protein
MHRTECPDNEEGLLIEGWPGSSRIARGEAKRTITEILMGEVFAGRKLCDAETPVFVVIPLTIDKIAAYSKWRQKATTRVHVG